MPPPYFYDDEEYRFPGVAPPPLPPAPPGLYGGGQIGGGAASGWEGASGRGEGGGTPGVGRPTFNFGAVPGFTPPTFTQPTMADALAEPGYQFRLKSGSDALERSAAARGSLRTGGTQKGLIEYGQKFGAQEYGNVFDRALRSFGTRYQGARDQFAPRLAQWTMLSQAELAAALAQFSAQQAANNRGGGGGSSGGYDIFDPEPEWRSGGVAS